MDNHYTDKQQLIGVFQYVEESQKTLASLIIKLGAVNPSPESFNIKCRTYFFRVNDLLHIAYKAYERMITLKDKEIISLLLMLRSVLLDSIQILNIRYEYLKTNDKLHIIKIINTYLNDTAIHIKQELSILKKNEDIINNAGNDTQILNEILENDLTEKSFIQPYYTNNVKVAAKSIFKEIISSQDKVLINDIYSMYLKYSFLSKYEHFSSFYLYLDSTYNGFILHSNVYSILRFVHKYLGFLTTLIIDLDGIVGNDKTDLEQLSNLLINKK